MSAAGSAVDLDLSSVDCESALVSAGCCWSLALSVVGFLRTIPSAPPGVALRFFLLWLWTLGGGGTFLAMSCGSVSVALLQYSTVRYGAVAGG